MSIFRILSISVQHFCCYSNPRISFNNWLTGSQEEPGNRCKRGSASAQTMEAEPPDLRYQALPGNEYNHLGLLYNILLCSQTEVDRQNCIRSIDIPSIQNQSQIKITPKSINSKSKIQNLKSKIYEIDRRNQR